MGLVRLVAGDAVAEIDPLGAHWRRWSVAGRERLWTPDPVVWDATAPILFPVVGWTNEGVRVAGERFALDVHGFARTRPFATIGREDAVARFADRSDGASRRAYPFDWRLEIEFSLEPRALACAATVVNMGDGPMPYAFGLHPGFRWDAPAGAVAFDEPERADVPVITPRGLFSRQRRSIPLADRMLPLSADLMGREALCFLDARSRGVTCDLPGLGRLRAEADDMPHWALWSRPPAPFLCVESWTGHGDPDGFEGDLFEKPSMRVLAPGARARHAARYAILGEG